MRFQRFSLASSCLLLVFSLLFEHCAEASVISPVLIELTPRQRVVSVQLLNDTIETMTFQAETLKWRQVDDKDFYDETQDLLVAPPIAVIGAGAKQIFRITLRSPGSNDGERAYRLFLEDVTEETSSQPGVLKFHFSYNLPVFAIPSGDANIDQRWSLCSAHAGKGCVRLDNHGNRRIRFSELTVAGEGWQQVINKDGITVLTGAWKQWSFDLPSGRGQPVRITAKSEQGPISADISSQGPEAAH